MTNVGWWLAPGHWPLEADVLVGLLLAAVVYRVGAARLGALAPARPRQAAYFAGLLVMFAAIQSPLDLATELSFSLHMVQHMLLLLVVPPLVVLGDPVRTGRAALPVRLLRAERSLRSAPVCRVLVDLARRPAITLVVFAAVLWGWHLPVLYDTALRIPVVHELEHAMDLGAGLLYWSVLVGMVTADDARLNRLPYLLGGVLACWVLGIVLTFATVPLYPPYLAASGSVSATLAGQQLGAAIMWAPSMVPFDIAGAVLVQRWLAADERRATMTSRDALGAGVAPAGETRTPQLSRSPDEPQLG